MSNSRLPASPKSLQEAAETLFEESLILLQAAQTMGNENARMILEETRKICAQENKKNLSVEALTFKKGPMAPDRTSEMLSVTLFRPKIHIFPDYFDKDSFKSKATISIKTPS